MHTLKESAVSTFVIRFIKILIKIKKCSWSFLCSTFSSEHVKCVIWALFLGFFMFQMGITLIAPYQGCYEL